MIEYSKYIQKLNSGRLTAEQFEKEFSAFDQLPTKIRKYLTNYKVNLDSQKILEFIKISKIPEDKLIQLLEFEKKHV